MSLADVHIVQMRPQVLFLCLLVYKVTLHLHSCQRGTESAQGQKGKGQARASLYSVGTSCKSDMTQAGSKRSSSAH